MSEDKSPLVNFRTRPWFKAMLISQAQKEGRTLAGFIHNVLRVYMKFNGWKMEDDPSPEGQKR
jgi:hypothetical protein